MSNDATPKGFLHYALWGVQLLMALAFGMAGAMKLGSSSAELLEAGMTWVNRFPSFMPTVIGAAEVLGAVGLVLPAATRIQPRLTPAAAAALTVVMVFAALDHAGAGEFGNVPVNLVLGGLTSFVAWGRMVAAPIGSRA